MDYFEELKNIIKEKTNTKLEITLESELKNLGLDSLDLVEVILESEEKLNISFDNEELLNFKTVGDVVKSAEGKM